METLKKLFYVVLAVLVTGSIFVGGVFVGYSQRPSIEKVTSLLNKETEKPAEVDFSPFWTAWNTIDNKYVSNNGLEDQDQVWGAIEGLVASLDDPYSVFFPPEESKMFQDDMDGDFEGVGMEIGIRQNLLTVVAPLKGTPAEKSGIKAGDKIIKINEDVTTDITVERAVRMIRGPKGTSVNLTVLRDGESAPLEIEVFRDVIQIPVLKTEMKSQIDNSSDEKKNELQEAFIIRLYNFSAPSSQAFQQSLQEFVLSGKDKLIVDLRGNPGGYLDAAVDISSWFLPAGKIVAREKFGNGEERLYRSKGYNIFNDNLKMAILIDQGSASASEIFAGAMQEHGVATLIGTKSFGKGSVQELIQITPETSLKLTIARWLTPNGNSISKEGLTPDVEIKITKEDLETEKDPQMEKAIEVLSNK